MGGSPSPCQHNLGSHCLESRNTSMHKRRIIQQIYSPDISSVGWIIHDRASNKQIKGLFAEQSPDASSYKGELMGMLVIHGTIRHREGWNHKTTATIKARCSHLASHTNKSRQGRQTERANHCRDVNATMSACQYN